MDGRTTVAVAKKLSRGNETFLMMRNERFQEGIPQALIAQCDAVIGFDTSSWILIQRAHQAGKPFLLDASIAHPLEKEKVYEQLRHYYPAWQQHLIPKSDREIELELQEMKTADHIVAATSFTRNTYIAHGVDAQKISINPYGIHLDFFRSKWDAGRKKGIAKHCLRILRHHFSPQRHTLVV